MNRGGALSRLRGVRLTLAIHDALTSPDGLDAAELADTLECDRRTLERYLTEFAMCGRKLDYDTSAGVWRYRS